MELIELIKKYCPDIIGLISKQNRDSGRLEKIYFERIKNLNLYKKEQELPHCLVDWVLLAESGDLKSKAFLKFANKQVSELNSLLDNNHKNWLRDISWKILISLDTNAGLQNNPTYMNFLGETFGLYNILTNASDSFELVGLEVLLPNKKHFDVVIRHKLNKSLSYVDFSSIHLPIHKIDNHHTMLDFLENKFNQKLEDKTEGLQVINNQIQLENGDLANIAILPIIWVELVALEPFRKVFETLDNRFANVLPCCSLISQQSENGEIDFKFSKVSDILKTWTNQFNEGSIKN